MEKITNYIDRSASIITGKKNLEPLYEFKDFPVFFGCVDSPREDDVYADMKWEIDPETGVIQLTKLIPLDILYQEQHVDGTGPTWQAYYTDFADYVSGQNLSAVLEIGGGAGALAKTAVERNKDLHWTVIEPNPLFEASERISVIKGFFDEKFKFDGQVDAVVFSQVMEHVYDPSLFLRDIAKFLKPSGKLIFAYPNLKAWLQKKYTNAINFEHTMFLTDYFVDYLLAKEGFRIIDKHFYKEHSVFYTVERSVRSHTPSVYENKYDEYKKIFLDFIRYHEGMVRDLNKKIERATQPVFLFGAHIFSEYLFAFGLQKDKIAGVLDNSPLKQGRRLYGTDFVVQSPKSLKDKGPVNIIVKAGVYTEEIKKDILENINSDTVFW